MGLVLTAVALGAALFRGVLGATLRRTMPYVQQVSALLLMVAGSTCSGPTCPFCCPDRSAQAERMAHPPEDDQDTMSVGTLRSLKGQPQVARRKVR